MTGRPPADVDDPPPPGRAVNRGRSAGSCRNTSSSASVAGSPRRSIDGADSRQRADSYSRARSSGRTFTTVTPALCRRRRLLERHGVGACFPGSRWRQLRTGRRWTARRFLSTGGRCQPTRIVPAHVRTTRTFWPLVRRTGRQSIVSRKMRWPKSIRSMTRGALGVGMVVGGLIDSGTVAGIPGAAGAVFFSCSASDAGVRPVRLPASPTGGGVPVHGSVDQDDVTGSVAQLTSSVVGCRSFESILRRAWQSRQRIESRSVSICRVWCDVLAGPGPSVEYRPCAPARRPAGVHDVRPFGRSGVTICCGRSNVLWYTQISVT